MNDLEVQLGNELCFYEFIKSVHPNKDIRNVSSDSLGELNKLTIEFKLIKLPDKFSNTKNKILIFFLSFKNE